MTLLFAKNLLLKETQEKIQFILNHANYFLVFANTLENEYKETGKDAVITSQSFFEYIWPHLLEAWRRLSQLEKNKWSSSQYDAANKWLASFPAQCPNILLNHVATDLHISILDEAIAAADRIEDTSLEIINLNNLAYAYEIKGNYKKALTVLDETLTIAKTINDVSAMAKILNTKASVYSELGDIQKAIKHIDEAIKFNQSLNNKRELISNFNRKAGLYKKAGNIDAVITTLEKALLEAQEIDEKFLENMILANLSTTYWEINKTNEAIDYSERSLVIAREIGNQENEAVMLQRLSLQYLMTGRTQDAAQSYAKAGTILRKASFPNSKGMKEIYSSIKKFSIEKTRELIRSALRDEDAPRIFELVSKLSINSNSSIEKEFYKVVQQISFGIKKPDLSNLPDEMAQIIQDEIAKNRASE